MAKSLRPTKRWVRVYEDLFDVGGTIDRIVRECRPNVGELSVECRPSVGQQSDDVVPELVSVAERHRFIGLVCAVWHRFYKDWDGSSSDDVTLDRAWYDVDHDLGMPGLCKAMAKHGWLKIDGNSMVGIDLRKHFGNVIETNKYEAGQTQARRSNVGQVSAECRPKRREEKSTENPCSPLQAGDDGAPKKPKRLLPDYTPAFETFWRRYPTVRRLNKTGAFKVWLRDEIERPAEPGKRRLLDFVMESLENWIKSDSWQQGYVCAPTVWLNQKRWSNDPPRRENVE